jgi:outer membrane protein OmpA-like peptidoglycan-associated protein
LNDVLARQRAEAVVRMLKNAGVSDSRISYSSVGSDKDAAASPASNRVAVCIVK